MPYRRGGRLLLVIPLLVGALALAAQAVAAAGPRGRMVRVDGHQLYLVCAGKGKPVVMIEAGLGDWSRSWSAILARSGRIGTTVCVYDRLGLGRSDAFAGTRSIEAVVHDLEQLLVAANLRGPYVLGAGSMGGLVVRSYARLYPKRVAGMVLFDSVPDDWDRYLGISVFEGSGERLDIAGASARLRRSDRLGGRPLVVVEAGDESYLEQVTGRSDLDDYWYPAQRALARLSSNSILVTADGSPHWVQSGAPDLSAEALRLVVASVRGGHALPPCSRTRLPALGGVCG
jgi:pimeloyl-ACP methyl ester carboxylesterase